MRLAAIGGAAMLALAAQHGVGHDAEPATPAPAHGERAVMTAEVGQAFAAFAPARVDVVTGDAVRWTNTSVRDHTVTADDGRFDSGRMDSGETYTQTLDRPGELTYHCSLHAGMTGSVTAHDVLLRAPAAPAAPRRAFPLRGRAVADAGTPVAIEGDDGSGFTAAAATTVADDGTFAATVTPQATTTYRAVVGDRPSPAVRVLVLDRHVDATVRRRGRRVTVSVHVMPASPGQTVVLQLLLRHRFGWWPVRRAKLDERSRARFVFPLRQAPSARVLLTLPDGATRLASSGTLRTR